MQNQLAALTASEHPVLATDLYEQGLPVRDYYTKRLLNRINALPAGNVYHPVQIEAQQDVSHVRQMYLSTSMFDNAVIFRGSFQSLRVEYRHTHGVLLLWKKKDASHVFLRVHPRDMSQLIASHWSAILFWNNDGSIPTDNTDDIPEQNTNIDPPPGLPPQQNNNQDDDQPPEHLNTPPSSPHLSDVPMPDEPHTPHPGFPPDDDQFHTPFHSPPKPSDDVPDDEMHSPQDDPPDLPPHPSSPPDHPQPPFPGATGIPVAPDTIIVPNTIIPPNIDDTPMTQSTKRPPGDPPIPPATKARPSRQMPPSASTQFQPSNRLGVIHSHQSHQTRPHNPL